MDENVESVSRSSSSVELLQEYRNNLVERAVSEGEYIHRLISEPPEAILVHVYWANEEKDGTWVPNIEGHYAIKSAVEFVQAARNKNPEYSPVILTAGSLSESMAGNNISRIYRLAIQQELKDAGLDKVTVTDEQEFIENNGGKRLAADTRGELTFLDRYSKQHNITSALSIGRIEHNQRIQKLLDANAIEAEVVSIEGILAFFHPAAVERFIQKFSEVIEAEHNLAEAEKKKMLFMLIDRKGTILEAVAILAGPLKKQLYQILGQQESK